MKFSACFIALLLITVFLSAQAKDPMEIIDTLYAVNSLQGTIGYHIEANMYMGGVTPNSEEGIYAGDGYDWFTESNVSERSFLSFATAPIPENYQIGVVEFRLFEQICFGDDESHIFPYWYDGEYYPCLIARVDYGNTLETSDFSPTEVDDIGVISEVDTFGWRMLDITDAYNTDLTSGQTIFSIYDIFPYHL